VTATAAVAAAPAAPAAPATPAAPAAPAVAAAAASSSSGGGEEEVGASLDGNLVTGSRCLPSSGRCCRGRLFTKPRMRPEIGLSRRRPAERDSRVCLLRPTIRCLSGPPIISIRQVDETISASAAPGPSPHPPNPLTRAPTRPPTQTPTQPQPSRLRAQPTPLPVLIYCLGPSSIALLILGRAPLDLVVRLPRDRSSVLPLPRPSARSVSLRHSKLQARSSEVLFRYPLSGIRDPLRRHRRSHEFGVSR
jgi:hypothetical protein